MSHDVFISYSHADKQIADAICNELEENKIKCWIAPRDESAGKPFGKQIIKAIKAANVFVLVYSEFAQESKWVNREIHHAFKNNKPILSFNIDGTQPSDDTEFYLDMIHWIDAYPEPKNEFKKLVDDTTSLLQNTLDKTEPPNQSPKTSYKTPIIKQFKTPLVVVTTVIIMCGLLVLLAMIVGEEEVLKISLECPEDFVQVAYNDPECLFYEEYTNYGKNENITVIVYEYHASWDLGSIIYNLTENYREDDDITSFMFVDNIFINGIPAVKGILKLDSDISYPYQYHIYILFLENNHVYEIHFYGDDLQSLESLYESVVPTIKLVY